MEAFVDEQPLPRGRESEPASWLWDLLPQERQVLALIAYGLPLTSIARVTHRSSATILRQKDDARAKLGITSDAGLAEFLDEYLRNIGVTQQWREDMASRIERVPGTPVADSSLVRAAPDKDHRPQAE